jgi:hypothetical protein
MISLKKLRDAMININGKTFYGNDVTITNSQIIINGKNVTPGNDKTINIEIKGDVKLNVDHCNNIGITGAVDGNVKTVSGNVKVGGNVKGDITTVSGDVDCGHVGGKIKTVSGNIKHIVDDDEIRPGD